MEVLEKKEVGDGDEGWAADWGNRLLVGGGGKGGSGTVTEGGRGTCKGERGFRVRTWVGVVMPKGSKFCKESAKGRGCHERRQPPGGQEGSENVGTGGGGTVRGFTVVKSQKFHLS